MGCVHVLWKNMNDAYLLKTFVFQQIHRLWHCMEVEWLPPDYGRLEALRLKLLNDYTSKFNVRRLPVPFTPILQDFIFSYFIWLPMHYCVSQKHCYHTMCLQTVRDDAFAWCRGRWSGRSESWVDAASATSFSMAAVARTATPSGRNSWWVFHFAWFVCQLQINRLTRKFFSRRPTGRLWSACRGGGLCHDTGRGGWRRPSSPFRGYIDATDLLPSRKLRLGQ